MEFMNQNYRHILLALALAGSAFGQTLVDLRTQSKSIDFSALPSTRPVQVGTALPATCQVGQLFFKADAVAGANLYGCASVNSWAVQSTGTSGGGGSNGGASLSMGSQLGDLQLVRNASNVLAIGTGCSPATPCNVHFGSTVYSFTSGATATVSGTATGVLYVYVATTGTLMVGSNLAVACTGCTSQSGVTSFPPDSVLLGTWSVTNGSLDITGGQDFRALLGTKNLVAGSGIVSTDTNGAAVLSVDTTLVGVRVSVPPSSTAACQAGSWSYDANYVYVCVASNSWRRAQLASW
jgi:hypothetical protein